MIDDLNAFIFLFHHFVLRFIFCTAPGRLSHGKILIVSNLKVKTAGFSDLRRLRTLQHIHAVCPVLDLQADAEFCIA